MFDYAAPILMLRTRLLLIATCLVPTFASAADSAGYHPWAPKRDGVKRIDLSPEARARGGLIAVPVEQPDLSRLDRIMRGEEPADVDGKTTRGSLPDGWVQRGSVVVPKEIDDGSLVIEPETIFAVEDIPGNEYPRKHTLYLNFSGGMLYSGSDNSAESTSTLATQGNYPAWTQGENQAVAVAQAVAADFEPFGIQVVYAERPDNVAPYTMEMMGGDWTDTNLEDPAGGVAPGADCGALGQRHVVYSFETFSVLQMANTASQEAGHSYGLDHTFDCNSVMSYCAGGDGSFRNGCTGLCESQCQGPNSAGCQLTHEMFCGEGSVEQNDFEEMSWIFGTNEPDMEAPSAEIVEPADGAMFEGGTDINFRALVDDNYGGYGWKYVFTKDGEVFYDQPDYDREVDADYRAAVNLGGLEAGEYVLTVEVHDQYGNVATDSVTVTVGESASTGGVDESGSDGDSAEGDDEGDDDGDSGDEDSEDSGEAEGTSEPTATAGGTGDPTEPRGCSCSTDGPTGTTGHLAAWALFGVAVGRRTRQAARRRQAADRA